jgi:DNA-directed RNA polymerase specialized sigma24 family protein
LVERSRNGDLEAQERLIAVSERVRMDIISRYATRSRYYIDWDAREDMKQEMLLALLRCIHSYDPSRNVSFVTYYYASACRACADVLSKRKMFDSIDEEDPTTGRPRLERVPSYNSLSEMKVVDLMDAIEREARSRGEEYVCFIHLLAEGMDPKEACRVAGLNYTTAMHWKNRLYKRLMYNKIAGR